MLANYTQVLAHQVIPLIAGTALGFVLFVASRASARLVGPDDPGKGMALYALSVFARLAIATAILWAYKTLAPAGFTPFALSFAGGFLVFYTIEVVRFAGLDRYRRRPAAARR